MQLISTFFRTALSATVTITCVLGINAYAASPLADIKGDVSSNMRDLLKSVIGEAQDPPRSLAQARRRAEKAATQAKSVMRSQGYYGAQITADVIEFTPEESSSKRKPPQPVLFIASGPQFKFGKISVSYDGEPPIISKPLIPADIITQGRPALAANVVAAERSATAALKANGYPNAAVLPRKAVVDHKIQTMSLVFNFQAGDRTQFGEIIQTGDAKLGESWPKMISPFKPGDLYDNRKLQKLASRVVATNAFESAAATLSEDKQSGAEGTITQNVKLHIVQGKPNTISGEIGYSTTDGSGIELTYTRRNFVNYAQTLSLTGTAKTNELSLGANYKVPYLGRVDRSLDLSAEAAHQDTDAFTGERAGLGALVSQKLSEKLKVGLGLGAEFSRFEEDGVEVNAYLFEGLGRAEFDNRDSILDPSKGVHIETSAKPTYNFSSNNGLFTTVEAGASTYRRVSDSLIVAGRVKAGTIFGADQSSVPLNRRFYGGGGGSVRGFGYQSISPVDGDGDLIGGRSITEASAELRYHGKSPIGAVAFIDAGAVNAADLPNFEGVRYGAGIGLRYHTSFAPLRADIAIPLNKRSEDNAVQIYISIGQAF